jgi:hypothetical protein
LLHKPLCAACEQGADAPHLKRRVHPLLGSPSPEDAGAPLTRLSIAVRTTIASIMAGSDMVTSALRVTLAANPGASCSVSPARAISLRRTAPSFMGSAPQWS